MIYQVDLVEERAHYMIHQVDIFKYYTYLVVGRDH